MKNVAIALIATALSISSAAAADEPASVPRYPPSSVRAKLIAGGVAVTGLAYGAGFLAASSWPEVPGSSELKIPVVGSWLALAKNDCAPDSPDCGFTLYLRGILTAIGGLAQLGGLGIVGEGIFMTTEARPTRPPEGPALTVRAMPMVTASSAGLGVVGTF
jgi:hypothetical protein